MKLFGTTWVVYRVIEVANLKSDYRLVGPQATFALLKEGLKVKIKLDSFAGQRILWLNSVLGQSCF